MTFKLENLDPIALYAAIVSTVVACKIIIRYYMEWKHRKTERSKVIVNMQHITVHNTIDGKKFELLPLLVSNLGRESVIIKEVVARGPGYSSNPGWYREPAATYGIQEQILPKELKPGESVELPLFTIDIFRNQIDEIAVIDSDEKKFKVSVLDFSRMKTKAEELL